MIRRYIHPVQHVREANTRNPSNTNNFSPGSDKNLLPIVPTANKTSAFVVGRPPIPSHALSNMPAETTVAVSSSPIVSAAKISFGAFAGFIILPALAVACYLMIRKHRRHGQPYKHVDDEEADDHNIQLVDRDNVCGDAGPYLSANTYRDESEAVSGIDNTANLLSGMANTPEGFVRVSSQRSLSSSSQSSRGRPAWPEKGRIE